MAGPLFKFTGASQSASDTALNGGLNSTAGNLELKNNESSDLQNIDFDKFGSILKRNGYAALGTASLGSIQCDGLHWFEWNNAGSYASNAIYVGGGQAYKMDSLNGVWAGLGTGAPLTAANHCDFENFLNQVFITNGSNPPVVWAGTGTSTAAAVPSGLTKAKYVRLYNNYLFYGNVTVSNVAYPTRVYWSALNDPTTWGGTNWLEVGYNDGQEITGLKVLADRLVVYKTRSIYNIFFTGNADFPFILPGGGKSNSAVGCIAPWSIQVFENGHIFLAPDGLYYYDGVNSYKLSYRIQATLASYNGSQFKNAVSAIYKAKNMYFLALPASGNSNNAVIVWDYFNNAFSVYKGMSPSAMSTFFVNALTEEPFFADYSGWTYQMDTGTDDYPLNVKTAINAYYYTNWKDYDDLCDQKGIPHVYLYYRNDTSTLTFAYSFDFSPGDTYSQSFSLASFGQNPPLWGSVVWGQFNWGQQGGGSVVRRDLTGRGRVIRFKFANANKDEQFKIDGFGSYVHSETNV